MKAPSCFWPLKTIFDRVLSGVFLSLTVLLLPQQTGQAALSGTRLSIVATNGTANVSWMGSGFWLQAADSLGDPLDWYNSPWPVSSSSLQYNTLAPMDSPTRFFRLISSPFLPPPTELIAQAGDSSMSITWNTVSNAATYNLYFASASGVTPGDYGSLSNGMVLTGISQPPVILDSQTLTPGVRYYFVATAVNAGGESTNSNESSDIFGPQGQVHGTFFTPIFNGTTTNDVFVPGVSVTLQSVGDGTIVASDITDEGGDFIIDPVPGGVYQLCWSAPGFLSNCSTQLVVVSNDVVVLNPQEIDVQTIPGTGMVYGNVTLQDGTVPVFDTNDFGSSLATTVTLQDNTGALVSSASANEYGDYLLMNVPPGPNFILTASAEATSVITNIDTDVVGEADLVFPNSPPVIQSVVATLNGQVLDYAPAGATVQLIVTATDPGNHFLHYSWLGGNGAENLVSKDASNISLTLPATNETAKIFVQVNDGYGGYASSQLNLDVESQLGFSGTVEDTSGNPIPSATVSVNSTTTQTDTNGMFSLTLPTGLNQFAFSIIAAGFTPYYDVLDDSAAGNVYQLVPLETVCTNWTGVPESFSDVNGTTVALQANSLESAPGVPYLGPICVSITTYDPCADSPPYPAGNVAIDDQGNTNWISPQTTAYVWITDAANNPLLIDPGLPALLTLPLGQTCTPLTNAPCVIPEWVWDSTHEVWRFTGLTTNQAADCASGPFAGPMLQMGLQAAAPAAATCQVTLEVDRTINTPVVLRVSSQAKTIEINQITQTALAQTGLTVPVNQPITFQMLNPKEAPNDYYTNPNDKTTVRQEKDKTVIWQVTQTFQKNSSLTLGLSAQIPLLTPERVEDKNHFLTYKSGYSDNNFPKADAYYAAIGFPRVGANNFLTWMVKNAFMPANGTYPKDYVEDASALYFNATDLGFARSMHMKTKPGIDGKMDIAYFVVNYVTMADAVADLAGQQPQKQADATVAMDYAAELITNMTSTVAKVVTNRITKFYVFDQGNSPVRALRPNAELDPGGAKIPPNLCVTCHGSAPLKFKNLPYGEVGVVPPNGDVKGYFIPFDPESFTYAPSAGLQQAQFKALNLGIYQYTPLTPAMAELISNWYGGPLNNANNNNFVPGAIPAGWNANAQQKALYANTVRISCRACHTMRPNISFNTYASLSEEANAEKVVCSTLRMPNAQRTFTIFWGSMSANILNNGIIPNQPLLLKNQFNWGACPAAAP